MTKLLVRCFIKDYNNVTDRNVRERYGILGGVLGIICNMFLFCVKLSIGVIMSSIAIISDAFNNLSDMGSSIIGIIGAKMSNMRPDKEHPFGHGRLEYISSLIVSFFIIIVGFELLKSSGNKVFNPELIEFNWILILILTLSVLVKVWMFIYNRYLGNQVKSSVLLATASDSISDVISTGSVIVATVIGHLIKIPVDGYIGVAVSFLIMYNGYKIARDTIGMLLGAPPDPETVNRIDELIMSGDGIVGVHDLIVHDYGPGRIMASAHAEVPDDIDIVRVHEVIDALENTIEKELNIHIVLHMDPVSVNCPATEAAKKIVKDIIEDVDPNLCFHDFRITDGENHINLIFDLVVPCDMPPEAREAVSEVISKKISEADKRYGAVIKIDSAY